MNYNFGASSYYDSAAVFILIEKYFQSPFLTEKLNTQHLPTFLATVTQARNDILSKNRQYTADTVDREIGNILDRDYSSHA